MSLRFDFRQAAHAARQLWVKYEQQYVLLEKEWEVLHDRILELSKDDPEFAIARQQFLAKGAEMNECCRQISYWQNSYQEAVQLF